MTHPFISTRYLIVHLLAAGLLCSPVVAKPKQNPPAPTQPATKAGKGTSKSNAKPAATKPAAAPKSSKPMQTGGESYSGKTAAPPANAHLSLIANPDELLARVPSSGPLSEESMILLAIANNPQLERRRAAVATAKADERAERDLRSPELRLSYGTQDDDFIRNPYTETTYQSLEPLVPGNMNYHVIESQVIPGSNGEYSTVREWDAVVDPFNPEGPPLTTEPITSYERKVTNQSNGADDQFSAMLRFQVPHPVQKKARIARASAEITLSVSQYLSDEDRLVRDVRDLYQTLAVLESRYSSQQKRRQNFATFESEMDHAPDPTIAAAFAPEANRARVEMAKVFADMSETQRDIDKVRNDLASLCGLGESSRIQTRGLITRRIVDLATLDPDYLMEMAMLYRADLVESRGRLEIAKANLAEANAAKIPWATFLDVGWSRRWRDGYSGQEDEWFARVGIDIPIWDWTGINKRAGEYKKAAVVWESQFEKQRKRVSADIALATERLRKSSTRLREYETAVRREQAAVEASLKKVSGTIADLNDYSKNKRAKYDAEDLKQVLEIGRFDAFSDYNKALVALENAIGVRIEKVLNGWRQ